MKTRLSVVAPCLAMLLAAGAPKDPIAAAAPAPTAAVARKPKLVVFVAVDQFRADYIEWYGGNWKHGLRRLLDKGAWFRNANYPYLGNVTCPGHTTLGTGAYPHTHGMILNDWWDRTTGKISACTDDPGVKLLGYMKDVKKLNGSGDSGKNMLVPTLADEMKAQLQPMPRVVSFSMKARSTIGLAGHKPDVAAWFEQGSLVTSTAFTGELTGFVKKFVADNPIEKDAEGQWTKLLDEKAYKYADDVPQETTSGGRVFPHPLKRTASALTSSAPPAPAPTPRPGEPGAVPAAPPSPFGLWERSPWSDRYLGRLASAAVSALGLGKGPSTDYLSVSFSALDTVGHPYGPRSHEVQDVLARLDVTLGELLADIDKKVGADNYVLGFSADHGVMEFPEQLKADGKDAGRVSTTLLTQTINDALNRALGPGKHVATVRYTEVYLAPGVREQLKAKPEALKATLDAARAVPGVQQAFFSDDLLDPAKAKDPLQRAAALSHLPARNGDIILVPKRYWIVMSAGTTHGTNNDYDQHVPVVLFGAGVKAGKYDRAVSPADIAPTLAKLVGVKLPKAEGKPLDEALAK
jgi:hypothetical protein